ncbi:hypothetical protein [uncultured Bradyrhizobium sp.]|uniref:hypothetical protein n=1 Tax=uncultured Bradyrhizobium sp. TaxID=199684 RepID=UPI0035C9B457
MRSQRLIAAVVVIALSGALAGCSSSLSNWDPTDLLDFLDTKKKLPGERKPVFPQGVPGLEQGVPKDLYKGAAQPQEAPAVAAVQPVEQPKPKSAAKSKGRGSQPAAAPAQDSAQAPDGEAAPEEEGSTAAAPPAPKPKKIVRRRTTAPPPDASAAQPAAQSQQSASPFPAPMPSGTFQR